MPITLPAQSARTRSLTAIVPEIFSALEGKGTWLAPAQTVVLVMLDGVGASQLRARAGHARFLSSVWGPKDTARTVFPSTTAAALSSLFTGRLPGEHGVVGYQVRVPETGALANQLHGWEDGELTDTWHRAQPLVDAHAAGHPVLVVSKPAFAASGLTRATTGNAEFFGVDDLADRIDRAAMLARERPGALIYLYIPELDGIGHRSGWESDAWTAALEQVDAGLKTLVSGAPDAGILVTADHGMVDVPAHRHVLLGERHPLWDGVDDVAGEPRMLHLYAQPGRASSVADAWQQHEGANAWVMTREEAIETGLFGPVSAEVRPRVGDVLVAARARVAYYDDRLSDKRPQSMIGQHGSLTVEESVVPLVRAGVFTR